MKIAAPVLAYNVSRFIKPVLENMAPYVDKIYVAYSEKPFGYSAHSRSAKINPTSIDEIKRVDLGGKVEIIEGDWLTEEDARNACLSRAKFDGFDWLLIQDADEFYTDNAWDQILSALKIAPTKDHFTTTWYNFWKSPEYVLVGGNGSIKQTNAGFAIRCKKELNFTKNRTTNAISTKILDAVCFHYGYALTDIEVLEKIKTWGHSAEFNTDLWYQIKWLDWTEDTKNLHPTYPGIWRQAIRFPLEQPKFSEQFSLEINYKNSEMAYRLKNIIYDAKFNIRDKARLLKRTFLC